MDYYPLHNNTVNVNVGWKNKNSSEKLVNKPHELELFGESSSILNGKNNENRKHII